MLVRRLDSGLYQTQLSSHQVENIKTIFKQELSDFRLFNQLAHPVITSEQMELLIVLIEDITTKIKSGEQIQLPLNLRMLIGYLQHDKKVLSQFDELPMDKQEDIFKQAIKELENYRMVENSVILH